MDYNFTGFWEKYILIFYCELNFIFTFPCYLKTPSFILHSNIFEIFLMVLKLNRKFIIMFKFLI